MTDNKPERLGEIDQAATAAKTAVNEVEGDIRSLVRRDFRRRRSETSDVAVDYAAQLRPATSDVAGVNSLIGRFASASVSEVERVIAELSGFRDMLRSEGERVQREIAGYASLSRAAMTSMKIVADTLAHSKSQPPQVGQSEG